MPGKSIRKCGVGKPIKVKEFKRVPNDPDRNEKHEKMMARMKNRL